MHDEIDKRNWRWLAAAKNQQELVLDCVETDEAPFSKGTLVAFRCRLIEGQMDRRLIERTIEIASQSLAFGPRALRAALDSSSLWGGGRVEDTYNLVGHALKKVMCMVADQQGRELEQTAPGRSRLRGRVAVEHTLAHVGQWQGLRARYRSLRKNIFDLCRCAVFHNLHVIARSQVLSTELQVAA